MSPEVVCRKAALLRKGYVSMHLPSQMWGKGSVILCCKSVISSTNHKLCPLVYKDETSRVVFGWGHLYWNPRPEGHKLASCSLLLSDSLWKVSLQKCDFPFGSLWFPRQHQMQESNDGWVHMGSQECGTFAFALASYSCTPLAPAFVLLFSLSSC